MARGDVPQSPWVWDASDYLGRMIRITIPFDVGSRAILNGGSIHRDVGCLWSRIVWDVPSSPQAKRSPSVPVGDTAVSAAQIQSFAGFTTIDQLLAVQITAEA